MKYLKIRLTLLFSLFFLLTASAATAPYRFHTMSPAGGFGYDGVMDIEQDGAGFVWVMMDYELYRFDGYHYKKHYPVFASLLPDKRILFINLESDTAGRLFVNTNNGIFLYDPATERWEKVHEGVSDMKADSEDRLWIRTGNTWHLLDLQSRKTLTPLYDGKSISFSNQAFCTYRHDSYSFVRRKIYRFNRQTQEFELCCTLPEGKHIIRFAQINNGKLWVFADRDGLYKIDLSTFTIEKHFGILTEYEGIAALRSFYVDNREHIWIGTIDGVYIFDSSSQTLVQCKHSGTEPFSLPNNSVWKIYGDRQSNVWIGMYTGKLCYVNLNESNAFNTWTPHYGGLTYVPVSTFAEDDETLWIGTEGGGINLMNKATGTITPFSHTFDNVKSLTNDRTGNIWIATFREGLNRYDLRRHKLTEYRHDRNNASSLLANDVRKTALETDSGLWVAYQYPKPVVSFFSFRNGNFTHYELDRTSDYLFDILRQGDNKLWAITHEALYCLNIHTHRVEKKIPADSTNLGFFTLSPDDAGNIWIGTIGNGLIKFDVATSRFMPVKDVSRNRISAIYTLCYENGRIWMGTNGGLYSYDIGKNQLTRFDEDENTQGQVYYPLASMKGSDGKLYFGGTRGFTAVDPRRITRNSYPPHAVISEFFIDHQSVQPEYSIHDSIREVVLGYDQPNFGFQFSSDNFHVPGKNRFKYRLRGYNDEWITVNAQNRTVMYSKVPAGTYYFEVYAANNDGIWSETPAVVRIIRKTAPWLSLPAYLLYFLAFAAVVYAILRYYNEKKRLKLMLYQESVERDKEEQIHQAQLRFFTNISHDFRTPLSLILAVLEKLRCEGLKEYYYRILNSNAQRLLNLVNELMDFRTLENGRMKLKLEPLDINRTVTDIGNDFADYAQQRHLNFHITCDRQLPLPLFADRNIVEKIVMNLLNNAFKYTPDGGTICLETDSCETAFVSCHPNSYTVGECPTPAFALRVRDTGVGISAESIGSVFERFYKVDTVHADSHLGTGIGLALVKSLVLLHKGSVTIYSERGKGTDMVVRLPLNKETYSPSDFRKTETEVAESIPGKENIAPGTDLAEEEEKRWLKEERKAILLVEDNADLRQLIAETLNEKFQITQAKDGLEALQLMEKKDFDLVISDIMMPNKDGVSLCNEIKNNLDTSHIPVVLLTAKTSLESKLEGVDSGADLYLEKPIDLTYLKLSLLNIFRNRQQLKEHYARNYYADSSELATNEQDNRFLKQVLRFIEANMDQPQMDVNRIAEEMGMSRSKLYAKIKSLTGKSVVEFVLNCRLRKAARLIIEKNMTMREVMSNVGIESQPYFTNAFKKVFGETPTSFAAKHKK